PIGGAVKQYQILISPEKLASYGIALNEVMKAAEASNENSSGGSYMDSGSEYLIRGIGRVQRIDDIKNSVVAVRGGVPILMRDIAEVLIGPSIKIGDGSVGAKPAVILTVQKQPQTNTLELTRRIERSLDDIRQTLPPGVVIDSNIFKQADFITVSIDNVVAGLRDGALLVVVVIFLFLWNVRTTIISVLAIPLSIIVTIIVFEIFGIMINTMSLGGIAIAIGALVDDAIIYVENVYRRLRENALRPDAERLTPITVIFAASKEIRSPMVNATLIIIIVFLPLFLLSGVEGRLLQPMGFAYVISILASLLVAMTVTPVLSYYLLPSSIGVKAHGESWLVARLKVLYERTLTYVVRKPDTVLWASLGGLIPTLAVMPFLGR
ncbi:hypothetical protein ANRL2_00548, partial [Anaerolineae bacterium]